MTTDQSTSTPLRVDLRTVLEALSSMLAFVLPAVVSVGLERQAELLTLLAVGAAIVFIQRLLGKNQADIVNELSAKVDQLLTRNVVLASSASPSLLRKADEAAQAIGAPAPAKPEGP